jgi:anti-sigma factor ChrR (cupin superfamily)
VRAWVLHDHGHSRSALLRFEPGASIPGHRHATHEECFVLAGSLEAGAVHVGRHDFHLAPAGSRHAPITSREGGVALLRGTSVGRGRHMLREYLAGFLPGAGAPAVTLRAQEGEWRDIGAGVQVKSLWHDGAAGSALLRLQARACFSPATGPMASEYLILDGEAFIGDILLREGEFQHQPAATGTFDIASESGMLCFVHGGVEALGA